jgi:uncharacterized protein YndB with AHSA1/START domain
VTRADRAARRFAADPDRVFAALIDPEALLAWLPPTGMSGRFEHIDMRAGGSYRMVLTYAETPEGGGKTTEDDDVVDVRIIELVPGQRIVQAADFVSDDPAFAGTMRMTWTLSPASDGTLVELRADDVPAGISADDHAAGLASSLDNLAVFLGDEGEAS